MLRRLALGCLMASVALVGCASGGGDVDAGPLPVDAGPPDAGQDGGTDAGPRDSGPTDGGPQDGGPVDGGDAGPVDAGPLDAGPMDAGPMDAGPMDAGPLVCTPSAGNIVINEVMVASQSGGGDEGEWFEIRNRSSCTINLAGLVIEGTTSTGAAVSHNVVGGLLTASGFFLMAQNGSSSANHGLPGVDYVYGDGTAGIAFSNSGDSIRLTYMGATIDTIAWGSTDHSAGESRQLDRGASASGVGLGGADWCRSTAVYSMETGGPFRGTPGARNDVCP